MGVYTRYRKNHEGLRELVQLLETTPLAKREKMIEAGMDEDPELTEKIMKLLLNFQDVLNLSDAELAEVLAESSSRIIATAVAPLDEQVKGRFLRCSELKHRSEIREYWARAVNLTEASGAQFKLIEGTRKLEKKGYLKFKKIPTWDQVDS